MKSVLIGGAAALPLLLCSAPALADEPAASEPATEIVALGLRPEVHGPAGTMGDHVHRSGELMLGLMVMHESYGGSNRSGTTVIDDAEIAAASYTVKSSAMTMDMAMLHVMWAPSDRVTLMLVPSWMRMGMTMEGLPPAPGAAMPMAMPGGHGLMPGETMAHSVEGLGDTQFGALVALSRREALSVHAGLMVSAPTGSVRRKNASGSYVHYMMQGGSGTWDLNPTLTLKGASGRLGWGAQAGYVFRAEKANAVGFRFGDRFTATGWLSHGLSEKLSLSARLAWSDEGAIKGHYNGPHGHASPPDRQANYGGRRLDAGLGANLVRGSRWQLGAEASVPLYQYVNGIQLPRQVALNATINAMF